MSIRYRSNGPVPTRAADDPRRLTSACGTGAAAPAAPEGVRRAFTLIELLVVTAAVALLLAIVLPALSAQAAGDKHAQGVEQMRAVGQVISEYASDYDNFAPISVNVLHNNNVYSLVRPEGPYYQKRGQGGWSIWDTTEPNSPGPIGLGTLVPLGYMKDALPFFHPAMRDEAIGGGTARHWFNVQHNWGKRRGDPTTVTTGFAGGDTKFTSSGGGYIQSTLAFRGGDWTPQNGNNWPNTGEWDDINHLCFDCPGFTTHVLAMWCLYENLGNRNGGCIDYMMGDLSVANTKLPVFLGTARSDSPSNTGIAAIECANTPSRQPTTMVNSIGTGMGASYWMYLIEQERAGK